MRRTDFMISVSVLLLSFSPGSLAHEKPSSEKQSFNAVSGTLWQGFLKNSSRHTLQEQRLIEYGDDFRNLPPEAQVAKLLEQEKAFTYTLKKDPFSNANDFPVKSILPKDRKMSTYFGDIKSNLAFEAIQLRKLWESYSVTVKLFQNNESNSNKAALQRQRQYLISQCGEGAIVASEKQLDFDFNEKTGATK